MIRKVLMTADAVGGVWTHALDLARGFAARGTEIVLAVMGPAPAEHPPDIDVRHADLKLEWMENPWTDVDRAAEWLLSLEREIEPDIIHLNGYAHATLPWRAPKLVVAHSCVLSWWEAVHHKPAPPEWDEYRARVCEGVRAADLVVAPSRAMLAAIERHYGQPSNAAVIPNGSDPSAFRTQEKEPFILTAGRFWDQGKNLKALDRAAAESDWPVYAAGEGGSAKNIKTLGRLSPPALRDWFSRASIYALPARYEPFGLSILEAALSGCALVLGDIPSLRENWTGAAVFVPPEDSDLLAKELQTLIHSGQQRSKMRRAARERAGRFTLDKMIDSYANSYAALRCRSHPATAFKS